MAAWGVAITEPQRHRLATEQLSEARFEFFMPWREQVRIARGRHHRLRVPYFGRYVFVAINEAWIGILKLRGIAGMLLHPETLMPWQVDDHELNFVRTLCDDRGIIRETDEPVHKLRYGDLVYVDKGPLANLRGTYDCRIGKHREAAIYVMFGAEQRVLFRVGELKAVALG